MSMHVSHLHHSWKTILDNPDLEPQQRAYWEQYNTTNFLSAPNTPNKFFLRSHIALTIVAWVFLYPLAVLVSGIPGTLLYLPLQTLQTATGLLGLFCLVIFGATAPHDLYPNNSYSKFSVVMAFFGILHWVAAVIKALAAWAVSSRSPQLDGTEYLLANLNPASHGHFIRPSQDSGHGTSGSFEDNQEEADGSDDEVDNLHSPSYFDYSDSPDTGRREEQTAFETTRQTRLISRIMENKTVYFVVDKFGIVASLVYMILNRPLFVVGYAYLLLGVATFYRMGLSNKVFNLLAHFIKGSVFFMYGVLTLGRYLGAFSTSGMAWNIAPGSIHDPAHSVKKKKSLQLQALSKEVNYKKHPGIAGFLALVCDQLRNMFTGCTMEFIESFLIFFYGSTNIFLEHLGNTDGVWSHKDLQHGSIAFMYIGGGLCGLLIESKAIRRMVNRIISTSQNDTEDDENSGLLGRISINPIPSFIVFWTGVLMSMHQQASQLSTIIHMQWGYLLSIGALFRLATYLLIFFKPPRSTVPSRPITEVITSFCLLCGGLVFMESNTETVESLLYRNLDAMFTLNVTVGITALIMSWIMLAWAFKSWVASRQKPRFVSEQLT